MSQAQELIEDLQELLREEKRHRGHRQVGNIKIPELLAAYVHVYAPFLLLASCAYLVTIFLVFLI
jgi:hypothetical protein